MNTSGLYYLLPASAVCHTHLLLADMQVSAYLSETTGDQSAKADKLYTAIKLQKQLVAANEGSRTNEERNII
ncbi:hypothetical protein D3Z53_13090 [Lachnospiraceae bacterium]|nr:hypothetical protein [Lachnospiraceae bacterium]